jgi:hypothetical protein
LLVLQEELTGLLAGGNNSCKACEIEGTQIHQMNCRRFFDFREMRDEPKPFLDHIADLRKMLIKMVVVLALTMGGAFAFQKTVVEIIERPLVAIDPARTSLTNFGVADPQIDLAAVRKVTLSPWLPDSVAESVTSIVKRIDGCEGIDVNRSSLTNNSRWRKAID